MIHMGMYAARIYEMLSQIRPYQVGHQGIFVMIGPDRINGTSQLGQKPICCAIMIGVPPCRNVHIKTFRPYVWVLFGMFQSW